jgi:hypothetical protein
MLNEVKRSRQHLKKYTAPDIWTGVYFRTMQTLEPKNVKF